MDPNAQNLIQQLLNSDKNKRLGADISTGTDDVKRHPFFGKLNWKLVEKRMSKPPFQPEVGNIEDLSFWENAAAEIVADEEEINHMVEGREDELKLADEALLKTLYAWVE